MQLSILMPARNEMFLNQTIQDVLAHIEADTEVIAVLDGQWASPPVQMHPRVTVLYEPTVIGQRGATNVAARASTAKYVMKLDAHCSVDQGFDRKLIEAGEELGRTVTQIPRMYNLHAFDWKCRTCQHQTYQGPTPKVCVKCQRSDGFDRVMIWQPRRHKRTDFARFDKDLHFQYWLKNKETGDPAYEDRPEVKAEGDIADTMTSIGACFFMARDRFFELGGLDEKHGFWGQFGVEIALKSWLSGGRHVVNKRTWFAHMFRTQGGDFSFPYPVKQSAVEAARAYSRDLWVNGKWPGAVRQLQWVLDRFAPVPDWHGPDLPKVQSEHDQPSDPVMAVPPPSIVSSASDGRSVGLVYYSDGRLPPELSKVVQRQLQRAAPAGSKLVSCTLVPMAVGENIHLPLERGILTMFKQILAALEAQTAEVIFLTEHDVLYDASHFAFRPPRDDVFYYNQHVWKLDVATGQALHYRCNQTSGLCASRALLVEHYRKRVARVEREGFTRAMGFEPGTHRFPRGVDEYGHAIWWSERPNVDLRHHANLTQSRWKKEEFRNQKFTDGWTEADAVPGWPGRTRGRMGEWMASVAKG